MNEKNNPWTVVSESEKYNNNWIQLTEFDVINPAGNPGIYGKVHFKNIAIGVLPLDADFNTWLVGQYRFPINQYSWEIPEGGGSIGSDPLISAKRELLEETGLSAEKWQPILQLHLSNSVSDELSIVYLAQNLSLGQAMPEETEQLLLKKIPFAEAYAMVKNNEITDAISVAAIQKLQLMLLEGTITK